MKGKDGLMEYNMASNVEPACVGIKTQVSFMAVAVANKNALNGLVAKFVLSVLLSVQNWETLTRFVAR